MALVRLIFPAFLVFVKATISTDVTNLCRKSTSTLAVDLGDFGTIWSSVPSVSVSGQGCRVKILACDECKLNITIHSQDLAVCTSTNMTVLPRYATCLDDCTHMTLYEPAYTDVTTRYIFSTSLNYLSISSSLVITLCNPSLQSSPGNITVNYKVLEKMDEYKGSTRGGYQVISSPNFPLGYAVRGEVYTYRIRNIDPGGFMRVVFTDWDLSPHSRITLSDNKSSAEQPWSVHYGSSFRPILMSRGPQVLLMFYPDVGIISRTNHMGFQATLTFVPNNTWLEKATTECGHYYKYTPGGIINFHGPMRGLPGYFDCVWVITKHSAFDFLHLRITNISTPEIWIDDFSIHSGITSNAPTLSSLQDHQLMNRTFEGQDGFYIHLKGFYNLTQYMTMSFAAFNLAKPDGCPRTGEFECASSHCIDKHLVCDGKVHCPDGSDESPLCTSDKTPTMKPIILECKSTEFTCKNRQRCVPLSAHCDSWLDCQDGSDEYMCSSVSDTSADKEMDDDIDAAGIGLVCPEGQQLCLSKDQCIYKDQLCDTVHHCWDRSDENNCPLALRRNMRAAAAWNILLPVGIALCVVLAVCVGALCIRSHIKQDDTSCNPGVPRRSSSHSCVRRTRTVHSVTSETPLSLDLSRSASGMTASELGANSPQSCDDSILRSSPDSKQSFRFPGVRSGNGQTGAEVYSPSMLSPRSSIPSSVSMAAVCEQCTPLSPDSDGREAETPLLGSLAWALPQSSSRRSTASSIGSSSVGCRSQTSVTSGKRPHCDHCCQRRAPARSMVLTRPARPSSRRNHHSREPSGDTTTTGCHHHTSGNPGTSRNHHHNQGDALDPQEEPLLSEAYSCNTLLTECGGTLDNTDAKSALLRHEMEDRPDLTSDITLGFIPSQGMSSNQINLYPNTGGGSDKHLLVDLDYPPEKNANPSNVPNSYFNETNPHNQNCDMFSNGDPNVTMRTPRSSAEDTSPTPNNSKFHMDMLGGPFSS